MYRSHLEQANTAVRGSQIEQGATVADGGIHAILVEFSLHADVEIGRDRGVAGSRLHVGVGRRTEVQHDSTIVRADADIAGEVVRKSQFDRAVGSFYAQWC